MFEKKWQSFDVGFKAFILNNDKFLILKQKNKRHEWELPGGCIDIGEERKLPQTVLRRELREELGSHVNIQIKNILAPIVSSYLNRSGVKKYSMHVVYAAKWKSGKIRLSPEHSEFAWIDRTQLQQYKFLRQYKKVVTEFLQR